MKLSEKFGTSFWYDCAILYGVDIDKNDKFSVNMEKRDIMDTILKIKKMNIEIKKLNDDATIPEYQTSGSAGFDLSSVEDVIIDRGCTTLVKTGLAFAIPEGYEMQIRPRSGLALKQHLTVLNSPGTIDSDYRGDVGIILHNAGNKAIQIGEGDRIAQGVITPVIQVNFEEKDELTETERGDGGFGSTN